MAQAPDFDALSRAEAHARNWLTSLPDRRLPPQGTIGDARARLGSELAEAWALSEYPYFARGRPRRPATEC